MLTLYGVYRSRASRPLWLLAEGGLPFTHVPVIQGYRLADPAAGDAQLNTASAAYLAVNPMGQIPALTDDGVLLTESMAITLHIAQQMGAPLGPRGVADAAVMANWAFFAATSIEAAAIVIFYAHAEGRAGTPAGAAEIAAATDRLARPLARIEAHLTGRDWLLDRFTAADICVAECLRYAQGHAAFVAAYPASFAWLARCHARPAFQKMWAARLAEPA